MASAFGGGWFKSTGKRQVRQGRLLPGAASKNLGKINQTVQFHQGRTEKGMGSGDRTRGYAQHQKFLLFLFQLHARYNKEMELNNYWMSRNMYPDNPKKWLILTKGRLQKELRTLV